jgi:hypothetical protein
MRLVFLSSIRCNGLNALWIAPRWNLGPLAESGCYPEHPDSIGPIVTQATSFVYVMGGKRPANEYAFVLYTEEER